MSSKFVDKISVLTGEAKVFIPEIARIGYTGYEVTTSDALYVATSIGDELLTPLFVAHCGGNQGDECFNPVLYITNLAEICSKKPLVLKGEDFTHRLLSKWSESLENDRGTAVYLSTFLLRGDVSQALIQFMDDEARENHGGFGGAVSAYMYEGIESLASQVFESGSSCHIVDRVIEFIKSAEYVDNEDVAMGVVDCFTERLMEEYLTAILYEDIRSESVSVLKERVEGILGNLKEFGGAPIALRISNIISCKSRPLGAFVPNNGHNGRGL